MASQGSIPTTVTQGFAPLSPPSAALGQKTKDEAGLNTPPCLSQAGKSMKRPRIRFVKRSNTDVQTEASTNGVSNTTATGLQSSSEAECLQADTPKKIKIKLLPRIVIVGEGRDKWIKSGEIANTNRLNIKRHLLSAWHQRDPAHYNEAVDKPFERHFASYYRLELENKYWRSWLKDSVIPKEDWKKVRAWSQLLGKKRDIHEKRKARALAAEDRANAMDVDSRGKPTLNDEADAMDVDWENITTDNDTDMNVEGDLVNVVEDVDMTGEDVSLDEAMDES